MSKAIAVLLMGSFSLICFHLQGQDYEAMFGSHFMEAKIFLRENAGYLHGALERYGADPEILLPVVFPELMRFSRLRNTVETAGLYMFYTTFGTEYADFSIGPFQMKPSFIEKMELYLSRNSIKGFEAITPYPRESSEEQGVRRARLKRLSEMEWQLLYLSAFYRIVLLENPWLKDLPKEEQILLFSVFYNKDMFLSRDAVWEAIGETCYPVKGGGYFVPYADIALYYYMDYSE